jgi:hypothetical protein
MSCEIKKYIKDANIPQKEKYRLDELHNKIGEKAIENGNFRRFEGSIIALKNKLAEARNFTTEINKEYNHQITKLISSTKGFLLETNVLTLEQPISQISYENLVFLNPSTSVSEGEFNNLSDEEQEVLIYQTKNC